MTHNMSATDDIPASPVKTQAHGNVLVAVVDHPPVNALSAAVRRGLMAAIEQADANPAVSAVLLVGAGANFIAGADIREFGQAPQAPLLTEVCNRIEACSKPVVAAMRGAALGGGLEVAMAAHYRIATADARLGLPEVQLGLLPGAGGTQRAPRLIGAAAALDLMLSGRQLGAGEALALGLIDKVACGSDALVEGLAEGVEAANGQRHRRNGNGVGPSTPRPNDSLPTGVTPCAKPSSFPPPARR